MQRCHAQKRQGCRTKQGFQVRYQVSTFNGQAIHSDSDDPVTYQVILRIPDTPPAIACLRFGRPPSRSDRLGTPTRWHKAEWFSYRFALGREAMILARLGLLSPGEEPFCARRLMYEWSRYDVTLPLSGRNGPTTRMGITRPFPI